MSETKVNGTRTIDCDEALRLLAEHLDGELEAGADSDVHHHLERCRSCYSRAEFERQLKRQLAGLRALPVRPSFEDRIREVIDHFEKE